MAQRSERKRGRVSGRALSTGMGIHAKRLRYAFVALIAMMAACAPITNPALVSALGPIQAEDPVVPCDGDECKQLWERAQFWVARHSEWKIQTATDVLIQTYNANSSALSYGFTVTKEPLGEKRYRITLEAACGNMFGCLELKPGEVRAAFAHYLRSGKDVLIGVAGLMSIR